MKKILSLILAGLMTLSCAAFVAADDAAVDAAVEQSNTAEDYAIEFLANYGIFKGTSAAELVADADASIQRYQMALFVSRISTGWVDDAQWEDGPANNSTFEDIGEEPANKYLGALSYANQNGIIEGYSATKFAPYDGITYRDALTMVVRTLGYKGLAYPWGYIQKAVELGLTADVNVAYTDNLTRGQVAVIIYNAMFAATKSGETLAKKIFDCDFGWEEIVIVASNEASFAANGLRAKDGYVAFKLLKDNGALGDKTYYVKKAELGLDDDHDDELQVGAAYIALFTVKDDIATMVDADSLNYKTVYNLGITDNAGEPIATLPVQAELANYNVVKEYQKSEVISAPDKHETFVYGGDEYFINITRENGKRVALDWTSNNIMQWSDKEGKYVTAWVYNKDLNRYYQYDVDTNGVLYINWMSDKEFEDFYKAAIQEVLKSYQEYKLLAANEISDTAYSKLRLFDVDGDGLSERSLFKTYKIGQIYVDAKECATNKNNVNHADGKKYPTYKITDLEGNVKYEQFVEKDHKAHEYLKSVTSRTDKDGNEIDGYAWLNVADFVTTFYKEDGSFENGSIVLYNVNKTTGEIEIIKHITAKGAASDDADSYIATGVLKAYSVTASEPFVNIDGEKLPLGYAKLNGAVFGNVSENMAKKLLAAKDLDECQMQYITYVVVDGRVVDIDLRGETSDVIIVLGYAGVTSDGYIAVYGYGSKDTSAKIYRIASYNGWKKGDYRYYPMNAWTDEAFKAGTIYNVTSHDDETDSYNVYTENTDMSATAGLPVVEFTFDSGYRIEKTGDKTEIKKMSKDDKYVIVYDNGTIFVKTGIISNNNWKVSGYYVKTSSDVHLFYVSDRDNNCYVSGFNNTANEIGYVLYDKDSKISGNLSAAYDDAIGSDWYLLGSTQSTVVVRDLLTGNKETVLVANNVDLVRGRVYVTYNFGDRRVILNQFDDETHNPNPNPNPFLYHVATIYNEWNVADARFMVDFGRWVNNNKEWQNLTFTKADAIKTDKQIISMLKRTIGTDLGLVPVSTNQEIIDRYIGEMIGDINFFYYKEAAGKVEVAEVAAKDLAANATYTAAAIYDVATKKVVVYIYSDETISTETVKENGKDLTLDSWKYDEDHVDSKVIESTLKLGFDYTYTSEKNGNGEETRKNFKLGKVSLYFKTLAENHGDIAKAGYLFGVDNVHGRSFFSNNNSIVRYNVGGATKTEEIPYTVDKDSKITIDTIKCDECDLVDTFTVDLSDLEVGAAGAYVKMIVKGQNTFGEGSEFNWLGNNVEVFVRFTLGTDKDGNTIVVADLIDDNGAVSDYYMLNDVVSTQAAATLHSVDLQKAPFIG